MPRIEITTSIDAPVDRVFDLSRSIDLHAKSASSTSERAIGGVTSGLIGPNQEVTWRAKHFGVWHTLTVRVTEFDRPNHFRDIMTRGAFKRMEHDHFFHPHDGGTVMRDVFAYESPFGIFGRLADLLVLEEHLRHFLKQRNEVIKKIAESTKWNEYLKNA